MTRVTGSLELLVERNADGTLRLVSPEVGALTCALKRGDAVAPGQRAGVLIHLGRAVELLVPAGAAGVVVSQRPERVHKPVGYGDLVAELDPAGVGESLATPEDTGEGDLGLVLRADQSGRFYHRAAPDQPPLVSAGDVVEAGTPIGLIEVMKTYRHVVYRATGGLPARARVVRVLAEDGADVEDGAALIEVEAAS